MLHDGFRDLVHDPLWRSCLFHRDCAVEKVSSRMVRVRRSLIFVPTYAVRETYVIESAGEKFVATRVYPSDKPSDIAGMRTRQVRGREEGDYIARWQGLRA
jgi:hypothetical protein